MTRSHRTSLGLRPLSATQTAPTAILPASGSLRIGRDPSCEVVVDQPLVSWHHARLERQGRSFALVDLGSTNGTFVDGQRIQRTSVMPGAVIELATAKLRLDAHGGLHLLEDQRGITLDIEGVTIEKGRGNSRFRLLEKVSLGVQPGELVGIMGPSGAGKTTLLEALNGYDQPTRGRVAFNGRDLYRHYDQFRLDIGYVPQDDILHPQLTVREALYYTARLRLPPDTRNAEITARIGRVLRDLHIEEIADRRIGSPAEKDKVLSGGQRKRVNLAMELITDPWLLFLDEPTSGLSSADALQVLKVLRQLADGGRTILLSIHQPSLEVFQQMTHLLMLAKDKGQPTPARLAYYGPAYPDSIRFFQPSAFASADGAQITPEAIFDGLADDVAAGWARRYEASPYCRRSRERPTPVPARELSKAAKPPGLYQWWTLLRRNLAIKRRDLVHTAILLFQAPMIGLLIVMVFGVDVSAEMTADNYIEASSASATTVFLMAVATLWFGCSNAAREIVAERAIYHRERMVNLKIPSYVGAKMAMLGMLGGIQCAALLAVVHRGCGLLGPWPAMFVLLLLTALVGTGLGLILSALAETSEVAISLVPLILLPMVILGGIMQPIHRLESPGDVLAEAMASRWSFEGLLQLESEARPSLLAPPLNILGDCQADTFDKSKDSPGEESTEDEKRATYYDTAESYFPQRSRKTPRHAANVLTMMLGGLVASIGLLLKHKGD